MKKVSILSLCLLSACVTINIYFPAKAADKVADEIIKGIQEEPAVSEQPVKLEEPEAAATPLNFVMLRWLDQGLNLLITPAHAAADLSIDSPDIRQLRSAMKKRYSTLLPYYKKQYIGIQSDGMLAVRNTGSIPLQERNKVKKLVAAENQDRSMLYKNIAAANGRPDWEADIKSAFAKRWVSNAQTGWSYQQADGSWQQK